MKVAVFGNNLNNGYRIARYLRDRNVEADVFFIDYGVDQCRPEWWTAKPVDTSFVHPIKLDHIALKSLDPLAENAVIANLYATVGAYDLLFLMEEGPALFSELEGIPKLFQATGADLKVVPFAFTLNCPPALAVDALKRGFQRVGVHHSIFEACIEELKVSWTSCRQFRAYQKRQRRGLAQCTSLFMSATNSDIVRRLGLEHKPRRDVPFPLDPSDLEEIDIDHLNGLRARYADCGLIFFHPTRQFYLRLDGNKYLKDNDKLIRAFARFTHLATKKCKLLLVNKGRDPDILNTRRLISDLGIMDAVEWIDEMPNRLLRSYYQLDNTFVFDQFNPNVASLGHIGSESSYAGKIIVTSFHPDNNERYGGDMPKHVFPASTDQGIFEAMAVIDRMTDKEWRHLQREAKAWFLRHHTADVSMPNFLQAFEEALSGTVKATTAR